MYSNSGREVRSFYTERNPVKISSDNPFLKLWRFYKELQIKLMVDDKNIREGWRLVEASYKPDTNLDLCPMGRLVLLGIFLTILAAVIALGGVTLIFLTISGAISNPAMALKVLNVIATMIGYIVIVGGFIFLAVRYALPPLGRYLREWYPASVMPREKVEAPSFEFAEPRFIPVVKAWLEGVHERFCIKVKVA